jgi:hypothetical protein
MLNFTLNSVVCKNMRGKTCAHFSVFVGPFK